MQVATHLSWAPSFQKQFAQFQVNEHLFEKGERVLSCAGSLAGVDLMLHLIADPHRQSMAGEVADQMLHSPIRSGTAAQRHTLSAGLDALPALVGEAVSLIETNIAEPLTVPELAKALATSQRQPERQFRATTVRLRRGPSF
jgi:transcriptional regulator GlxA family with amidase domain